MHVHDEYLPFVQLDKRTWLDLVNVECSDYQFKDIVEKISLKELKLSKSNVVGIFLLKVQD